MESRLAGVLPVLQTPYGNDERIDFATLDREIDWLYEQGVDGLVMAMVSEVLRLSDDERRQLAEYLCRRSQGRGTVVVSVGAESTYVACERARHAEGAGATAVMAIPPLSIPLEEDQLRIYFERIIQAITIPVVVQDASGYVGRPMSIEFQARLLHDFGPRVQFKPEAHPIGPRLSELLAATVGRAEIYEGSGGAMLVDSFRRGIVGTMPGGEVPDAIVALWNALRAGNATAVARIDAALQPLLALQTTLDSYLAVEKHILVQRGVFQNTLVRGPVNFVLDDRTRTDIDTRLAALQQTLIETSAT